MQHTKSPEKGAKGCLGRNQWKRNRVTLKKVTGDHVIFDDQGGPPGRGDI